jgi:AcrR family transcriptional regulator
MVTERTRLTYEDRRSAILEAARHEFARKGFRGTGTADIAARCGCSEPMLYKHFASKQELFAAVLTHTSELMGERVQTVVDRSESVTGALVEVAERAATDELIVEVMRLRMLAMSLVDEPAVKAALEQNVKLMLSRLNSLLTRARDRGEVRTDLNLEHVAWLWLGFTLSCGFRHAIEPKRAVRGGPHIARTFMQMLAPPPDLKEAK